VKEQRRRDEETTKSGGGEAMKQRRTQGRFSSMGIKLYECSEEEKERRRIRARTKKRARRRRRKRTSSMMITEAVRFFRHGIRHLAERKRTEQRGESKMRKARERERERETDHGQELFGSDKSPIDIGLAHRQNRFFRVGENVDGIVGLRHDRRRRGGGRGRRGGGSSEVGGGRGEARDVAFVVVFEFLDAFGDECAGFAVDVDVLHAL
jgi:hypothetical protein